LLHFLKCFAVSTRRARHCELWITNGTIYLWNFDTFETEKGRKAHLEGKIAEALMANAGTLFSKDPVIELVDLLAVK
jgi:hypothetical protein